MPDSKCPPHPLPIHLSKMQTGNWTRAASSDVRIRNPRISAWLQKYLWKPHLPTASAFSTPVPAVSSPSQSPQVPGPSTTTWSEPAGCTPISWTQIVLARELLGSGQIWRSLDFKTNPFITNEIEWAFHSNVLHVSIKIESWNSLTSISFICSFYRWETKTYRG